LLLALASFPAAAHQAESTQPDAINSTLVTATGTVAQLTVRNQLTGVTLRYFGLKVDQGGSYALTGTRPDQKNDGSHLHDTAYLAGIHVNVMLFSVLLRLIAPSEPPCKPRRKPCPAHRLSAIRTFPAGTR
jgi:hypothetical protein